MRVRQRLSGLAHCFSGQITRCQIWAGLPTTAQPARYIK